MVWIVPKVSFSVLVGLAAVFGIVVALSVVSHSLTPLIGVPTLAVAVAVALTLPRRSGPENQVPQPSREPGRDK